MAKIGEGDARWIVSERTDGKNVGNWHWSEYNLLPFFKQNLPLEIESVTISDGDFTATITKLDKTEGDFNAMNRKGKTIFVWDISLTLKWKGTVNGTEYTGTADVSEIYNDEDGPYRVSVKSDKDSSEVNPLKEVIRKKLSEAVKPSIKKILEKATEQINVQSPVEVKRVLSQDKPVMVRQSVTTSSGTSTTSFSTMTLKQTVVFEVPAPPLFESFTDERRVSAYTQGPAQIVPKPGGAFSLFGGSVTGEMITVDTNKKIVQKWRFSSWPENHFSQVTLDFEESGGRTTIVLTQTGVPSSDFDRTKTGWEEFFWRRIRGLFGWSYKLR